MSSKWKPFLSRYSCKKDTKFPMHYLSISDGNALISHRMESKNPIRQEYWVYLKKL